MKRTDFLKLGLGVALTPLVKVLPADAQPLDVVADEPLPANPVNMVYATACSAIAINPFIVPVEWKTKAELASIYKV